MLPKNKWKGFEINKEYSNHYFNIELKAKDSSGVICIESQEDSSESVCIDMKTAKLLVNCFKEMKWLE